MEKITQEEIADYAENYARENGCGVAQVRDGIEWAIKRLAPASIDDLEDHNCEVFQSNQDLLTECFDKALASDGGEYWIMPDTIIEELTKAGFALVKTPPIQEGGEGGNIKPLNQQPHYLTKHSEKLNTERK